MVSHFLRLSMEHARARGPTERPLSILKKSHVTSSLCCTLPPSHQFWCLSLSGFHLKSQGCCSRPSQCQHHQPNDTDTGLAVSPAHAGVPPNQLLHSRGFRKAKSYMETKIWPKINSNSVSQSSTNQLPSLADTQTHLRYCFASHGLLWPPKFPGGDLNWGLEPSPVGGGNFQGQKKPRVLNNGTHKLQLPCLGTTGAPESQKALSKLL